MNYRTEFFHAVLQKVDKSIQKRLIIFVHEWPELTDAYTVLLWNRTPHPAMHCVLHSAPRVKCGQSYNCTVFCLALLLFENKTQMLLIYTTTHYMIFCPYP